MVERTEATMMCASAWVSRRWIERNRPYYLVQRFTTWYNFVRPGATLHCAVRPSAVLYHVVRHCATLY